MFLRLRQNLNYNETPSIKTLPQVMIYRPPKYNHRSINPELQTIEWFRKGKMIKTFCVNIAFGKYSCTTFA
jgi:hypothetical protein